MDAAKNVVSINANAVNSNNTGTFVPGTDTGCASVGSNTTSGYSWHYPCACDKTGRALSVLRALMAKKVVKVKSIEKFVQLLDEISQVL
jgi:hypothetical protein